jgi:microcompartment protein CcmK/EutM
MARFCDHRLNHYLLSLLKGKREDKLAAVHVLIIVQQVSTKVEREAFADVETDSVAALILASALLIFGLKVHLKQVLFIFL